MGVVSLGLPRITYCNVFALLLNEKYALHGLKNTTYLGFMDLWHNNLTGRIPSGTQLESLHSQNPHIYDGNVGLCGYPLHKNCTDDNREPKHGDQKRDGTCGTYIFLCIGYVVGLWVVFCLFLFKKSWRIAHFRLFDKAFDKVCRCYMGKIGQTDNYTVSQLVRLGKATTCILEIKVSSLLFGCILFSLKSHLECCSIPVMYVCQAKEKIAVNLVSTSLSI